jgi:hypothetical protein
MTKGRRTHPMREEAEERPSGCSSSSDVTQPQVVDGMTPKEFATANEEQSDILVSFVDELHRLQDGPVVLLRRKTPDVSRSGSGLANRTRVERPESIDRTEGARDRSRCKQPYSRFPIANEVETRCRERFEIRRSHALHVA